MKRILISALTAASLAAAAVPAFAQPSYGQHDYSHQDYGQHQGWNYGGGYNSAGSIHDKETRISYRIDQGVRDGGLTRREAYNLRAQLGRIEGIERNYRTSDGRLDGRERADVERRLDDLSARVFANRHDDDRRQF
jgi:hypothetical protein